MHLLCFSSFCSVFIFLAFLFVSFLFMIPLSPVFSFQYLIAKLFHNSVSAQPRCLYPCISIFGRAEWCSSFDLSLLTLTLALVILAVFLFRFFFCIGIKSFAPSFLLSFLFLLCCAPVVSPLCLYLSCLGLGISKCLLKWEERQILPTTKQQEPCSCIKSCGLTEQLCVLTGRRSWVLLRHLAWAGW